MHTLGDVVTGALIITALIIVPYKLFKAWVWPHVRPFVMSRTPPVSPPAKTDIDLVYIPVEQTSMDSGMETDDPWQMPRVSAYLTDQEFIVFLARQKLRDGKYRLSANTIVDTVKGDRNKVLDVVRQVRQSPEYPAATTHAVAETSTVP